VGPDRGWKGYGFLTGQRREKESSRVRTQRSTLAGLRKLVVWLGSIVEEESLPKRRLRSYLNEKGTTPWTTREKKGGDTHLLGGVNRREHRWSPDEDRGPKVTHHTSEGGE